MKEEKEETAAALEAAAVKEEKEETATQASFPPALEFPAEVRRLSPCANCECVHLAGANTARPFPKCCATRSDLPRTGHSASSGCEGQYAENYTGGAPRAVKEAHRID